MNAVVSEKGQITIPKELRDKLGLRAGIVLEFEARDGKLVAWKRANINPFEKWIGKGQLPFGKNADDYLRITRDDNSCG